MAAVCEALCVKAHLKCLKLHEVSEQKKTAWDLHKQLLASMKCVVKCGWGFKGRNLFPPDLLLPSVY